MEKIRYKVNISAESCHDYDGLHDRLVEHNPDSVMYVCPIEGSQGQVYHFNGECGGLTVKVMGVGEPKWTEVLGRRKGFSQAKLILEEALKTNLIEEKVA